MVGLNEHLDSIEHVADFLGANAKTGLNDPMSKFVKPFVRIFVKDNDQHEWGEGHETRSGNLHRGFGDVQSIYELRGE